MTNTRSVVVVGTAVAIALLAPAPAHASPVSISTSPGHVDNSRRVLQEFAADPCTLPPADRTGTWACPTSTAAGQMRWSATAVPNVLPPVGGSGFCTSQGTTSDCYTTPTSNMTVQSAHVVGVYGYGSKTLGQASYDVQWRLNGHQVTTTTNWDSTGVVDNFYFQAQIDRTSTLASGATTYPVTSTVTGPTTSVARANRSITWSNSAYDNSWTRYTSEVGSSWEVVGYPGYWYLNVRTPIYTCASSTSACYFSKYLPAGAVSAGYA